MATGMSETRIAMQDVVYNEHASIQKAAMEAGLGYLPEFPDRQSITIVDYGCAQGSNSIAPLRQVLSTLPAKGKATLLLEDTPYNDFTTLAKTVDLALPSLSQPEPGSKILVFPYLIPRGFYNLLLPSPTADLGVSWSSLNYLSSQPQVKLEATASHAEFAKARAEALSAAGHTDLIGFLTLRSLEIRPGGYFVAAIGGRKPASDDRESETGSQLLQAALIAMLTAGKLSLPELQAFALFPGHERTLEEIQTVLNLGEIRGLWEVQCLDPKLIVHPAWVTYQDEILSAKSDSDKAQATERYARAIVVNLVSSAGWYWVDVLKQKRGAEWNGGDAFLDELTEIAVKTCVEKFSDVRVEIWYHYLKLKRRSQ
ncbi:S-adenosyl-L-methionine-dependent methyltransferase [Xylogone sp. PMI_703]|nr:S-adenosyl-L-methionine-dependent methyltransferase [Xylogone sp. PMI_703]